MQKRRDNPAALEATAKRAIVDEQKRASTLMSLLASIGSASPFIGLFGTVWGIMDAFLRIGREKTASLPVVAPAIGEALIATAIGLLAAIPAVVAYNAISKRLDDLLATIETAAEGWANVIGHAEPDWQRTAASTLQREPAMLLAQPHAKMRAPRG
jgi:biopolymer transport protein TolQ